MDIFGLLEVKTLEHELQQRMGRGLTLQEKFYLAVASACNQEGCALPQGVIAQQRWPS